MAKWLVNPRKRGGKTRRPRVRVHKATFLLGDRSPFKGRIHRVNPRHRRRRLASRRNPFYQEVGMAYHRNPQGLMQVARRPIPFLMDGLLGMLGAFLTITVPNTLFPVTGNDLMSKLLRGASRVVAGGAVYWAARKVTPGSAGAVASGVGLAAGGAFAFDLFNMNLILGAGDQVQTLGMIQGLQLPFLGGTTGSYVRALPNGGRLRAYTGAGLPVRRGAVGARTGYSIYGPSAV